MDDANAERVVYARTLDAMAEVVSKEADSDKAEIRRKALWGVAAGLEIAAALMRNPDLVLDPADAALLIARYKPLHYAYLVQKEGRDVRRKPPNLNVKRVVKGKKKE